MSVYLRRKIRPKMNDLRVMLNIELSSGIFAPGRMCWRAGVTIVYMISWHHDRHEINKSSFLEIKTLPDHNLARCCSCCCTQSLRKLFSRNSIAHLGIADGKYIVSAYVLFIRKDRPQSRWQGTTTHGVTEAEHRIWKETNKSQRIYNTANDTRLTNNSFALYIVNGSPW